MCVVQSAEGDSGLELPLAKTRRSGEGLMGDQGCRLHMGIVDVEGIEP